MKLATLNLFLFKQYICHNLKGTYGRAQHFSSYGGVDLLANT